MVKESFVADTPLEAYRLALKKYGSIDKFTVTKATQYKNSNGDLVAEIEIEVDDASFYEGIGLSQEEQLIEEINLLKSKMNRMKEALLPEGSNDVDKGQSFKMAVASSKSSIEHVKEILIEKGLEREWVEYMLDPFATTQVAEDKTLLVSFVLEEIEDSLQIDRDFLKDRVHLFVGTTGVGKTTTIAKIVSFVLTQGVHPEEIAVINLDAFRAGANEQLSSYIRKVGVDYYFVENEIAIYDLLKRLDSKRYLFIDSAGSAPYDIEKLINTVKFYQNSRNFIGDIHTNLVVSAGIKYRDLKSIYEHFSFLNIDSLIVTKIDETKDIGNIIAFLLGSKIPLSFISTGQQIPQDLELASTKKVLNYFIGDLKEL